MTTASKLNRRLFSFVVLAANRNDVVGRQLDYVHDADDYDDS
jgi:hypothetical protein